MPLRFSLIFLVFSLLSGKNFLDNLCAKFKRDITIIDLLKSSGEMRTSLTKNYDLCYVVCQKGIAPHKVRVLTDDMILLDTSLDKNLLHDFSECEDFDITLFPMRDVTSQNVADIINLANFTIFIGCLAERQKINLVQLLNLKGIKIIEDGIGYIIARRERKITQRGWLTGDKKYYEIFSGFKQKFFDKKRRKGPKREPKRVTWHKGINLWNFVFLNGVWPSREHLEDEIYRIFNIRHNDFRPWNMILSGQKLYLIDLESLTETYNPSYRYLCLKWSLYIVKKGYKTYPPKIPEEWCEPIDFSKL